MTDFADEKKSEFGEPEFSSLEGNLFTWHAFFTSTNNAGRIGMYKPKNTDTFQTGPGGEILSLLDHSGPLKLRYSIGANGQAKDVEVILENPGDAVHLPCSTEVELSSSHSEVLYACEFPGNIALTGRREIDHLSPLVRYLEVNDFLATGSIVSTQIKGERQNLEYDLIPISNPELGADDRVLIDVKSDCVSKEMVLIDGSPLEIEVLSGRGSLTISAIDLVGQPQLGEFRVLELTPGDKVKIEPGNTFKYSAFGQGLILRDTCKDFNPAHEVSLETLLEVAQAAPKNLGR